MAVVLTVRFVSCKPKHADIKVAIEKVISAMPDASGATIEVKDGIATISGVFKDESAKAAAEAAIKAVKGVKTVVNNGTVEVPVVEVPVVISADEPLIKSLGRCH